MNKDHITLKWGTLKSWKLTSKKGKELLKKYNELGSCYEAAMQEDTLEQKELICKMIDTVPGEILLDLDGKYVSKEEAKKYVNQYGKPDRTDTQKRLSYEKNTIGRARLNLGLDDFFEKHHGYRDDFDDDYYY